MRSTNTTKALSSNKPKQKKPFPTSPAQKIRRRISVARQTGVLDLSTKCVWPQADGEGTNTQDEGGGGGDDQHGGTSDQEKVFFVTESSIAAEGTTPEGAPTGATVDDVAPHDTAAQQETDPEKDEGNKPETAPDFEPDAQMNFRLMSIPAPAFNINGTWGEAFVLNSRGLAYGPNIIIKISIIMTILTIIYLPSF